MRKNLFFFLLSLVFTTAAWAEGYDVVNTGKKTRADRNVTALKLNSIYASYPGNTVNLTAEELDEVAKATMVGGATLTKLLGTSAWYAPGAAGAFVVEAIMHDQKKMVPCSVMLEGEYGESDICCGVPVILGKNGIEKIVELPLNEDEKAKFAASAAAVRKTNAALTEVGAL